jgi:hypothetical protein
LTLPTDASEFICIVCDETVVAAMSAECNWCSNRYHLNQRNDVVAKDCGEVWIDEQYMALQFACANCLRGGDGASAAPPARRTRAGASRPRRYRRRM